MSLIMKNSWGKNRAGNNRLLLPARCFVNSEPGQQASYTAVEVLLKSYIYRIDLRFGGPLHRWAPTRTPLSTTPAQNRVMGGGRGGQPHMKRAMGGGGRGRVSTAFGAAAAARPAGGRLMVVGIQYDRALGLDVAQGAPATHTAATHASPPCGGEGIKRSDGVIGKKQAARGGKGWRGTRHLDQLPIGGECPYRCWSMFPPPAQPGQFATFLFA